VCFNLWQLLGDVQRMGTFNDTGINSTKHLCE